MEAMIRREIALNLKIAKEAGLKFNWQQPSIPESHRRLHLGCISTVPDTHVDTQIDVQVGP
jgi:hypothetical protein